MYLAKTHQEQSRDCRRDNGLWRSYNVNSSVNLGDDEYEKIPTYVRDRNIIIPAALWGGDLKEYVTIPLPYGYNVFHNLGENAYLVSSGNSPEDAAVRSTNVFLGSFNPPAHLPAKPIWSVAKTATPQVAKPVLELVMNENYLARPFIRQTARLVERKSLCRAELLAIPRCGKTLLRL